MDDDFRLGRMTKWGFGAVGAGGLGAGAIVAMFGGSSQWAMLVGAAVLLLGTLLFGGYVLWRKHVAKRKRERFSAALEAQTAAAPVAISDPNQRAQLDRVRQKFQKGLQEFKNHRKDIYKLPWYVIIGESGSGKTEAIRHSGIEFPPGLQDELQGSGGTVNMDWWFTNRAIILDTAGSMLFNQARAGEAPEWREFLRLLRRARPHCPINGLFLVLSVESFIRDSAETIKEKASRLAQQLVLIQRTLDVRFPVYLLVTKCDLMTGFREFFDSIEDPSLQHQIFGWSNPDPLDSPFRPELVEEHLKGVAQRLRGRRMTLLGTGYGGIGRGDTAFFASSFSAAKGLAPTRRLDEVDSLFALPESVMRLAPRLRRYLEAVFASDEWSAKPLFLRGIYFTSSMREGKALDEAIAFATGLPLDQLPEDRTWEKNRAYFLRDLFVEKVFREKGLVTRATNALQMLRQRKLAFLGAATVALLVLVVFASYATRALYHSVGNEAKFWQAGASPGGWDSKRRIWTEGSILHHNEAAGSSRPYIIPDRTNVVHGVDVPVIEFHRQLHELATNNLAGSWFFRPVSWIAGNLEQQRVEAARTLFEAGVLRPLVFNTREKMEHQDPPPPAGLNRHLLAWWALFQLEADHAMPSSKAAFVAGQDYASKHMGYMLSYLTEDDQKVDESLARLFMATYAGSEDDIAHWPPQSLLAGSNLDTNRALAVGLENFKTASILAQTNIPRELKLLNNFADAIVAYHTLETNFLQRGVCEDVAFRLKQSRQQVEDARAALEAETRHVTIPLTNLYARYQELESLIENTFAAPLRDHVEITIRGVTNETSVGNFELRSQITSKLGEIGQKSRQEVHDAYDKRRRGIDFVDLNCLVLLTNGISAYEARWNLYTNSCALASIQLNVTDGDVGNSWQKYTNFSGQAQAFRVGLASYKKSPLADKVDSQCNFMVQKELERLGVKYIEDYNSLVGGRMKGFSKQTAWRIEDATNANSWFLRINDDWNKRHALGTNFARVEFIRGDLTNARQAVLQAINKDITDSLAFPVLRDGAGSPPMTVELLGRLRGLFGGLPAVLTEPGWTSDAPDQLKSLRETLTHYNPVVTALMNSNGTAARWQSSFIPPSARQKTEDNLRKHFRIVVINTGQQNSGGSELSGIKDPQVIAEGNLDGKLRISFRRLSTDAHEIVSVDYPTWGFARLINDPQFKVTRSDAGRKWRFQFHLKETQRQSEKVEGDLIFEVDFPDTPPLPPLEEWPRSK